MDVHKGEARAAAVDPAAARARGTPLDQATPLRESAPFDQHGRRAQPPVTDAPVHSCAAVGPDAALDAVAGIGAAGFHFDQFVTPRSFVPSPS